MKLPPRDSARYFESPDPAHAGLLLYGPDEMRSALKRQAVVSALLGPEGEAEMRLTRIAAAELRRDAALLSDALRAQGFFPGQRVVLLEGAGDGLAASIEAALGGWQAGDAYLVITAGQLTPRSGLRKLFEAAPNALAAAIYADPPSRAEIEGELAKAGLGDIAAEALPDIHALGQTLEPGDFRQTLEKLALYKAGDPAPVSAADLEACAPAVTEAGVDSAVNAAADGSLEALAPLLPRLAGQGVAPTSICIALQRHFRLLHAAARNPQGPEQALIRARPPVFGARRDRMLRQARSWGAQRLEAALALIFETDLTLRSGGARPDRALVERLMLRIAMMQAR